MRRALVAAVALMLIVPALASATDQSAHQRTGDRSSPSARVQATGSGLMSVSGRLTVNGLIVALAAFNVAGLLWLRGETRWLRNYLDERRRK